MWEKNDIREILISENEIQERAKQLGEQITKDYSSKKPLLVGLLRGSRYTNQRIRYYPGRRYRRYWKNFTDSKEHAASPWCCVCDDLYFIE